MRALLHGRKECDLAETVPTVDAKELLAYASSKLERLMRQGNNTCKLVSCSALGMLQREDWSILDHPYSVVELVLSF